MIAFVESVPGGFVIECGVCGWKSSRLSGEDLAHGVGENRKREHARVCAGVEVGTVSSGRITPDDVPGLSGSTWGRS